MVEQHLGEGTGRVGEQGVKSAFREGSNGGIRRGKHRERPLTGEVVCQAGRDDGRFQDDVVRAVDDDVHNGGRRRGRRRQHGVDDVHHTVGAFEIRHDDRGHAVDHDRAGSVNGDGHIRSVDRGDGLSIGQVTAHHSASGDVVGQDGGEELIVHQDVEEEERIEGVKCSVGRSEHREGAFAGQGLVQAGAVEHGSQHEVIWASGDDVRNGRVVSTSGSGKDDGVDDVDHAVVGCDVRDGDGGRPVDGHGAVGHGDGGVIAIEHGHGLLGHQIRAQHLGAEDVVEEDVGKITCRVCEEGLDSALGQGLKRGIGRGEHCERPISGEVVGKLRRDDGGFEGRVDLTVDHDIDHRGLGLGHEPQEEEGQKKGMLQHGMSFV